MANNNEFKLSGRGEVWSYTTIFDGDHAPQGFENYTPYTVALIQLEEGPMVTAMMTDLDSNKPRETENQEWQRVFIGQKVEMVTRKLSQDGERGMIVYGYKFRPVLKPAPCDFSLRKLTDLAVRCAADPKNETLSLQYLKMFPCHSAPFGGELMTVEPLDAESI